MALIGQAAVAMWWHIAPEQRAEFLDWHTHEHHPERLRIEGFRRGTRWASEDDGTGFFVMYELAAREALAGPAYMERLNNPTPWSVRMMPHHVRMVRSLCDVTGSVGAGNGRFMLTVRLAPVAGQEASLRTYLQSLLPVLSQQRGIAGAHLLEASALGNVAQTQEQRIRGGDGTADWVFLACGYDAEALRELTASPLSPGQLAGNGAQDGQLTGLYGLSGTLSAAEA